VKPGKCVTGLEGEGGGHDTAFVERSGCGARPMHVKKLKLVLGTLGSLGHREWRH
jgi:hypothetical protein